jgi:hypothetical protein
MNCVICDKEIPALRIKALPGTTTCVNCSTVAPKRGRVVSLGEGDHTYNELDIMDGETYRKVLSLEKREFYEKDSPIQIPVQEENELDQPAPSVEEVISKLDAEEEEVLEAPDPSVIEETEEEEEED